MKDIWFLIVFGLFLQKAACVSAQQSPPRIQFEHLTIEDGLPENSVSCMIQDHLGFIWLGTHNGLVRYDGTTMTVFQYDAANLYSLKGRNIRTLCEDRNGDIWVGCERLFRFERATQRFIEYTQNGPEKSEDNDYTVFIHEDKQGNIWTIAALKSKGTWVLNRFTPRTNTWTYFRNNAKDSRSLASNSIYHNTVNSTINFAFLEDRIGRIWVTTSGDTENTLHWFDSTSNQFIRFKPLSSVPQIIADFTKITFIADDNQGWLYLSSFAGGAGVFRANPKTGQVIQFKHNSTDSTSIQCDSLTAVYQSRDGMVWVPTIQGMDRLDPGTGIFTHLTSRVKDSAKDELTTFLHEMPNGDLWFLTEKGVSCYSKQFRQFIHYQSNPDEESALHGDDFLSFLVDRTGLIWIGSWNNGLNKQSRLAKFSLLPGNQVKENRPKNPTIYSVYEDPSETSVLWFGTDRGLDKLDKKTGKQTHYRYDSRNKQSIGPGTVMAITEDRKGRFWIATQSGGLCLMDRRTGHFQRFGHNPAQVNSLMTNKITTLLPASDGTLWIGTVGGLDHFDADRHTFTHYHKALTSFTSGLYSRVKQLVTAPRRIAAILHPGNLIDKSVSFNLRQTTDVVVVVGGEWSETVKYDYGWIEDGQGKLVWQASYANSRSDGLNGQVRSQIQVIRLAAGRYRLRYNSDRVYAYGDWKDGPPKHPELWGIQLLRVNPTEALAVTQLVRKRQFAGLSDGHIFTLREDGFGQIWIGSNQGGVQVFNPVTGKTRIYQDNLNGPLSVHDILPDTRPGCFWVCDNVFGLLLLNSEGRMLKCYNSTNGLPSSSVRTIQRDNMGNLWVGTSNGLSRFDPKTGQFFNYTRYNNLPDLAVNTSFKTRDGKLYFGSAKGMNAFSPDQITNDPFPPTVVVSNLAIAGNPVTLRNGQRPVHISEARQLTLSHNQNDLTLYFAALQYDRGKECQYAYKLTPIDDDWVPSGTTRQARYNDLSPGEYTFIVKAANADGVWNQKGASIRLTILPPWWQTWWAYGLYALLFLGGLRAYIAYRSRSLRRANQLLEETVTFRTNQVQQQKKEIEAQRDSLEQALTELKTTQAQLVQKEKLASLGELTAGIAHEIQNPLNFVNNYSALSAKLIHQLSPKSSTVGSDASVDETSNRLFTTLARNLQKISHHGERASAIVKSMLAHARTSAGEHRPTNLNALVEEYLKLAYHGQRTKDNTFNCQLATEFDPTIGFIVIAPQEIGQVLLNVLANAFYAVQQRRASSSVRIGTSTQHHAAVYQPAIQVTTQRINQTVEIRVADNGVGMSHAVKDKIFQPFYTTKPMGEGTGLGLSLSHDIIAKGHGGTLTVDSWEGEGTTFFIRLPCLETSPSFIKPK